MIRQRGEFRRYFNNNSPRWRIMVCATDKSGGGRAGWSWDGGPVGGGSSVRGTAWLAECFRESAVGEPGGPTQEALKVFGVSA